MELHERTCRKLKNSRLTQVPEDLEKNIQKKQNPKINTEKMPKIKPED
jgi:hypothetical protein